MLQLLFLMIPSSLETWLGMILRKQLQGGNWHLLSFLLLPHLRECQVLVFYCQDEPEPIDQRPFRTCLLVSGEESLEDMAKCSVLLGMPWIRLGGWAWLSGAPPYFLTDHAKALEKGEGSASSLPPGHLLASGIPGTLKRCLGVSNCWVTPCQGTRL